MSALDHCEAETIRAFEKAGWTISQKPFLIRITETVLLADASFERRTNGRNEQIIVVEIKCFGDPDRDLGEFYRAIGQYEMYRAAMQVKNIAARLYMTIPQLAYQRFVGRAEFMKALSNSQVNYVIIDLKNEEIIEWKP